MPRWITHWAFRYGLLLGFLALLYFAGGGRTKTLWGFQRRVNIRLQQIVRDVSFDNRYEGVIVAKGDGIFEFIDLERVWDVYRRGDIEIDDAAEFLSGSLRADKEFAEKVRSGDVAADHIVAMPLSLQTLHAQATADEAVAALATARGPRGLVLYPVWWDDAGARYRFVLRDHLRMRPELGSARALVATAQARMNPGLLNWEQNPLGPGLRLRSEKGVEPPTFAYVALEGFPAEALRRLLDGEPAEDEPHTVCVAPLTPWEVHVALDSPHDRGRFLRFRMSGTTVQRVEVRPEALRAGFLRGEVGASGDVFGLE